MSGEPTILRQTFGILARHFTVKCLANIKFFAGHFVRWDQTHSPDMSGESSEFRVLCFIFSHTRGRGNRTGPVLLSVSVWYSLHLLSRGFTHWDRCANATHSWEKGRTWGRKKAGHEVPGHGRHLLWPTDHSLYQHCTSILNSKRKYTLLDLSSTEKVADLRSILGVSSIPCEVGPNQLWISRDHFFWVLIR